MRFYLALAFLVFALPLSAQDDLPDGKGKETLENTCTECHGLDRALTDLRSRERWRTILVTMRAKGATMSDSELDTLLEYLVQNFGKQEVNVNKAGAKELEVVLQITSKEAAAIVRYRETHGPFREWRDLTRIDGVDKATIEAKKDRITF